MATAKHQIEVVLVYEHRPDEGKPIAAVAWLGEDWAIVQARDAAPGALGLLRGRLRAPIAERIKELTDLGYTGEVRKVVAASTSDAARMVLKDEGLLA